MRNISMQRNIEVFCKLILSIWVYVARRAQSSQNKKLAYLCNISKKNIGDEVDFLLAEKYKRFLQGDSITLDVRSQAYLKYLTLQVCNIFATSQGKQ